MLLIALCSMAQAQVTSYGDSPAEDFAFLPNSGSRVIQGFRVDMGNEKYNIVYSKPAKGVTPDTVFIQEYKKEGQDWKKVLTGYRTSKNTIFIWGKRGGFLTDDEKNGIAFTAFSEENLETEEKFIVGYFVLYKGEILTIEEDKSGTLKKSENFKILPSAARERIEDAFATLDKWRN